MHYRISFIFVTFICLFCFAATGFTQNTNTDEDSKPVILYSGTPKKYEIADIKVEGVKNYEDYVLIGLSGLSVGQTITVPGDEITGAIKRYWKHGLFSNVQITAEKIEGNTEVPFVKYRTIELFCFQRTEFYRKSSEFKASEKLSLYLRAIENGPKVARKRNLLKSFWKI